MGMTAAFSLPGFNKNQQFRLLCTLPRRELSGNVNRVPACLDLSAGNLDSSESSVVSVDRVEVLNGGDQSSSYVCLAVMPTDTSAGSFQSIDNYLPYRLPLKAPHCCSILNNETDQSIGLCSQSWHLIESLHASDQRRQSLLRSISYHPREKIEARLCMRIYASDAIKQEWFLILLIQITSKYNLSDLSFRTTQENLA
jgi:hypothetical protein